MFFIKPSTSLLDIIHVIPWLKCRQKRSGLLRLMLASNGFSGILFIALDSQHDEDNWNSLHFSYLESEGLLLFRVENNTAAGNSVA